MRTAWIVLGSLVVGAIVFVISSLAADTYTATAVLRSQASPAESMFGFGSPPSAVRDEREAATSEQLARLTTVASRTAQLEGLTAAEVSDRVSVSKGDEFDLISIRATGPTASQSAKLANTYSEQFVEFLTAADRRSLIDARKRLEARLESLSASERQGATGRSMVESRQKLGGLIGRQEGGATVAAPATQPSSPSSPKPLRDALIGAGIALLLGAAIALSARRRRGSARVGWSPGGLGLPTLATVASPEDLDAESVESLWSEVSNLSSTGEPRSVLVTSALGGAGVEAIAWALAQASSGASGTVLVEADLRRPSLAKDHGLKAGPGLSEMLRGDAPLERALQSSDGMSAIVAGPSIEPFEISDLFAGEAMAKAQTELSRRFDLVLISAPPIDAVPDAFGLLRRVDAVVVVSRTDRITQERMEKLRRDLDRLGTPGVGIVLVAAGYHPQPSEGQPRTSEEAMQ